MARKTTRTAVAYVRTAVEPGTEELERQSSAIRDFAAARRLEVVRTFVDVGRSGTQLDNRDGLKALVGLVESGAAGVAAVLVHDESRWSRRPLLVAYCEHIFRRARVPVHYCTERGDAAIDGFNYRMLKMLCELDFRGCPRRRPRRGQGSR